MNENAVSVDAFYLEEPKTPEEKRRMLLKMWEVVNDGIHALVSVPNPRGWHLQLAMHWLNQNNYKKDAHSSHQIREALADMKGMDAPLN